MLNYAQFSSAKSIAKSKLMQAEVFDEEKVVKSFSKFRQDAAEVQDIVNETWLRVEYDNAKRQAVQGEQFRGYQEDADLYPYWVYRGVMDDREREEHVELEGKVFRIGDDEGDDVFPPADWNCRCSGDSCDSDYLRENKLTVATPEETKKYLENNVDPQFRYNPAVQGMLPKEGSYFDVAGDLNSLSAKNYDLDSDID